MDKLWVSCTIRKRLKGMCFKQYLNQNNYDPPERQSNRKTMARKAVLCSVDILLCTNQPIVRTGHKETFGRFCRGYQHHIHHYSTETTATVHTEWQRLSTSKLINAKSSRRTMYRIILG